MRGGPRSDGYNILQDKMNKERNTREWRRKRIMGGRAPPSPSFRIFRMEEHRKQRPQNAVNAHERRIPRAQHHHNSERKLKEERAAKLRVERELQRARDRRALDAFRKSYAARAAKAFHEGREETVPPLGLGNFISCETSKQSPTLCQAQFSFPPAVKKAPYCCYSRRGRKNEA